MKKIILSELNYDAITPTQGCQIIRSDALTALCGVPDRTFRCCVTSPPYWGLRDYGVEHQIGAEPKLEDYLANLGAVFQEVRRTLKDDGTLWLNIGDSYTSGGRTWRDGDKKNKGRAMDYRAPTPDGLKPKDLIGVPWRLAFALQDAGWYLRSDIIWHKPNCQPESVKDRPTRAHEYLFLFSKSERYFYNHEAVKEPSSAGDKKNRRSVWSINTEPFPEAHFACVDSETECLTTEGWKRQEDLRPGMTAAQYDISSGLLSWGIVEDLARYEVVDQPMVVAKSRDVEMLLTPNHRTLISRRHPRTRAWQPIQVIRADTLKSFHSIPVSAEWEESGDLPFSPPWAELMGWYIAEGCQSRASWAVEIYQSKSANPQKVERIRHLLTTVGAEFMEAHADRLWQGRVSCLTTFQIRGFAAAFLRQWCPQKSLHPDCLTWHPGLLSSILTGLVDGDGHRRDDGRFCFIQRDRQAADTAQAIGVRLGYATMCSRRSENTYCVYFTEKRLISFRGTAGEGAQIETKNYTGIVWCPKLPKGTWIARKNGRAFITGNTFPTKLVEPCILAGSEPGDTVLDPFLGSGTVGLVSSRLGRRFMGVELSEEYASIARRRLGWTK